jgi:hypothetical protein
VPLIPLPGFNVFFSAHDATDPAGFISCSEITSREAATAMFKAARLMWKVVRAVPPA